MEGMKSKLSTLWIFATLNYLYCDVVTLMDPDKLKQFTVGTVGAVHISQGFLLGAGILVEIPIAMVLLSRVLGFRANRWANIVAAIAMTVVQLSSLLVGPPTPYYLFFSAIEIACTAVIAWSAWRWVGDERARSVAPDAIATAR
jgi:MFS family permease